MARARNIKPGLYKNEDLAECSIWARYIFPGLWTLADRDGRLEDRPKRIKAELLPFDDGDVNTLLQELHDRKFLVRYRNSDGSFIQISKFLKHQSPHYSEKPSAIMPPDTREDIQDDESKTPRDTTENSGSDVPIKRGSQPPESLVLNPDSPNPESLVLKKPKGRKNANGELKLPDWMPVEQWSAWIEARTKKKNPPTRFALELAIAKLEELRDLGHQPAAVLAQSAFHGWTDLYAPKG